jgi:hypothetical protein
MAVGRIMSRVTRSICASVAASDEAAPEIWRWSVPAMLRARCVAAKFRT